MGIQNYVAKIGIFLTLVFFAIGLCNLILYIMLLNKAYTRGSVINVGVHGAYLIPCIPIVVGLALHVYILLIPGLVALIIAIVNNIAWLLIYMKYQNVENNVVMNEELLENNRYYLMHGIELMMAVIVFLVTLAYFLKEYVQLQKVDRDVDDRTYYTYKRYEGIFT